MIMLKDGLIATRMSEKKHCEGCDVTTMTSWSHVTSSSVTYARLNVWRNI